jgi:voltage-gated potassium channel
LNIPTNRLHPGSSGDDRPEPKAAPNLVERRVQRIANARSVTFGLAATFVILAFVGAIGMRIVDQHNFPSLGLAMWWALQTVTTVGYGDVVPTTVAGRVVAGVEMVLGVSFIAFVTAGVTSVVIQRGAAEAAQADRAQRDQHTQAIVAALAETRNAIAELDKRLDRIEKGIAG